MTPDTLEYVYKHYRQLVKRAFPGAVVSRKVFRIFMEDINTVEEGFARVEKLIEQMAEEILKEYRRQTEGVETEAVNEESDTRESV